MKLFEMINPRVETMLTPEQIRKETNELLSKHSRASAYGQIVLMIIATLLIGHGVETADWVFFVGSISVLNSGRLFLILNKNYRAQVAPQRWYYIYSALTLGAALTWSLFAARVFYLNGLETLVSTEILIILAGIGSAAAAGLGCDRALARLFVTTILSSLLFSQSFGHGNYSHALSAILLVYMAFLWIQINVQHTVIWEMWGQREQVRALANASLEGVAVHIDGKVVEVNPSFLQIFKVQGDVIGRNVFDFAPKAEHEFLANNLKNSSETAAETLGRRDDGSIFPMEVRGRWFNYKGKPARITCLQDITDRKKAEVAMKMGIIQEKNLAEARERLAVESSQLKSQFLASMSHEIRTPLNAIIGITDILSEMDMSPSQSRYVSTLKESGESLLSLITDILDYSKIEADKIELELTDVSLLSVVESQVGMLASRAHNKGLDLQVFVDPTLPMDVRADGGRIGQILLNLLGNALKFTARGSILVRCFPLPSQDEKLNVRFEVTDTGIGIADAAASKLFSPFTQADVSITRKHGGTGLGLSICKKLVEMMGGSIGFISTPGVGTTFWFEIPFDAPNRKSIATNYSMAEWKDLRPVVIEDNLDSKNVLCEYLKAWDLEPRVISMTEFLLEEPVNAEREVVFVSGINSIPILSATDRRPHLRTVVLQERGSVDIDPTEVAQAFKGLISLPAPVKQSDLFNALMGAVKSQGLEFFGHPKKKKQTFQKARILVAEDNSVNQTVILALLKQLGLQGRAVCNGHEAIQALSESHYDVVLMDCQMPEMDGFEATTRIRQIEKNQSKAHIAILALTANVFKEDRDRCMDSGMNDFLSKPIRKEKLIEALSKYLPFSEVEAS